MKSNALIWVLLQLIRFGGSMRVVRHNGKLRPIWHQFGRFYFWDGAGGFWYEGRVTECNQHGLPANKSVKLGSYRDPVTGRFVSKH